MGKNRRRWNRKWVWDTNICLHLCHPCTNFKCLSIICIINMVSIIVHYYFCAQSTHKPVITWSLWDQDFLLRFHYKVMSEIFHIFCKCLNRLNFLQPAVVFDANFSYFTILTQHNCGFYLKRHPRYSIPILFRNNGIFSKWSRTFIEFREFRESEKSLRHELGSV